MSNRGQNVLEYYQFGFVNYLELQELDELKLLAETFDSSYKIDNVVTVGVMTEYYLNVRDTQYRILIERNNDAIRIMFEVFRDEEFRTTGITNKLSTKETLTLFGTVYSILRNLKFNHIFIDTHEHKKFTLYKKLAKKLLVMFDSGEIHIENTTIVIYDVKHRPKFDLFKGKRNESKQNNR